MIKNSVNSGNVSGTLHLGGLIGRAFASATFENCKNSGNVTGSYEHTSTKGAVGGIGGYMNVAATAINCENTGTITCLKANAIGGIFGNVNKGVVVENCKNSAAISGQYYVGGIVGDSVVEATATIGEKIAIRRFARFEMGEGLQKKSENLADAVAEQVSSMQK